MVNKVYVATDHAGYELKNKVVEFLLAEGYEVEDFGADHYDESDDYPQFIAKAAQAVAKDKAGRAIIFGGSGQGEAMVANRFKNVRATVYYGGPKEIITLSRNHNNANVLSLGARFVDQNEILTTIKDWLQLPFTEEERHVRRLQAFSDIGA